MKKLYDKDRVWFAVGWIIAYVLLFGNADSLSEAMGVPKLLTVIVGLILSLVLYMFVRKNSLSEHLGLCRVKRDAKSLLWYLPLIAVSSVNLWHGLHFDVDPPAALLYVLSMCFVAFLEELIFRGLLFKGMCEGNVKAAIIVSSVTFGVGHAVNLLMGAPLFETLMQLVYASAIGFCYTALFYTGGSIIPCIISHAVVNSTGFFANEPGSTGLMVTTLIQTVLSLGYGIWLLKNKEK